MANQKDKYVITTINGKQHIITTEDAWESSLYDNFCFDKTVVIKETGERINPVCIISIRKIP
jgi:hypothetical protein